MSEPRRLHPLSPLLSSARLVPQLGVVVLLGGGLQLIALPILAVVAVVVVGVRYLMWWMLTYTTGPESIVVESGLLQRRRRELPYARIQQIDLRRMLRHRVGGLVAVRIDSAGTGEQAEVVLDAVDEAEGERLRGLLRSAPEAFPNGDGQWGVAPPEPSAPGAPGGLAWPPYPATPPERVGPVDLGARAPEPVDAVEPVVALGMGRLALAGISGRHLATLGAAIGFLWSIYFQVRPASEDDVVAWSVDADRLPLALIATVAVAVGIPAVLALAAGASVLADGGFRLDRIGPVLRARRGLLDEREASLPLHRVQVVRIARNPLRRLLGYSTVSIHSAGASGPVDGADSHVTVPLLSQAEVDGVLGLVVPGVGTAVELRPAPPAARRRAYVRHIVPIILVSGIAAVVSWGLVGVPVGALALLIAPFLIVRAEAAYRALGWARVGDHVVARSGAFGHHLAVVPIGKAQSSRLIASWFQRRAGLATLAIDVAGRGPVPVVHDADRTDLEALSLDALGAPSGRLDEVDVRRRAAAVRASDVVAGDR